MRDRLPTLFKLFDRLKDEVSAKVGKDFVLTDRLKLLISAVVGIVILSGLIGMHQMVSALERDHHRVEAEMARLQATLKSGAWPERRQQSQVLKSLLEERLWSAQTPGLADASFERWLRTRLSPHKMQPIQQIQVRRVPVTRTTTTGDSNDPLANVQRMSAKLILPFNEPGLAQFLADIAEADKTVVVDRLTVRGGRNARIEMDVSAFYRTTQEN